MRDYNKVYERKDILQLSKRQQTYLIYIGMKNYQYLYEMLSQLHKYN